MLQCANYRASCSFLPRNRTQKASKGSAQRNIRQLRCSVKSDAQVEVKVLATLKRPLGVILAESSSGRVYVEELVSGGNAEISGEVLVGDILGACGPSADDLSPATSFDAAMDVLAGSPDSSTMTLELVREATEAEAKELGQSQPEANPIQVEFLTPDGTQTVTINPGEVLRTAMLDQDVKLYNNWGMMMNCGGSGSCGTCGVQVLEGEDQLSAREEVEGKLLKKKPESYRLACQTICEGRGEAGKVKIQTLPK